MTTDLTRLDLPDGAWVTFRTRFGWGPSIRVQAAVVDDGFEAYMRALVRETVTGWHLPIEGGGWDDFSPTSEQPTVSDAAMDRIDSRVGDPVVDRCRVIWDTWKKGQPDPKGISAPSTGTPQEPPSA